jgi:hypothetical protein
MLLARGQSSIKAFPSWDGPNEQRFLLHHLKGYNRLKAIGPIAELAQFGHLKNQ